MANNKTSFDYILEGIGNLPGSVGKAIAELPALLEVPGQIINKVGNEMQRSAESAGGEGGMRGVTDAVYEVGKGIVKDTWNFYTQPGAFQRMADDPVRPLMDAASVLSGGAAGVSKFTQVAKFSNAASIANKASKVSMAANIMDPVSLALEAGKFGARRAGVPQWLYKTTFDKLAGPSGNKLGEDAIQELVATANDSGYVRSNKGRQQVRGDIARLSHARGVETAKHTSDIPFDDLKAVKDTALNDLATEFAKGQDVMRHIDSFDTSSDFLNGTYRGGRKNIPGRNTYAFPIDPSNPNSEFQRRTNARELHESLAIDNELNSNYYDKARGQNPNIGPFDTLGRVYINRNTRKLIDGIVGPTSIQVPTGVNIGERVPIPNAKPGMPDSKLSYPKKAPEQTSFIKSGEEAARRINLRDADDALAHSNKAGLHQTAVEASGIFNPSVYTASYTLYDKLFKNPTGMTKTAAAINNKSRGPIAKGLRGGRRTLFELQDRQQPQMQEEQQEEQIPDNPFSSGYVK